MCENKTDTVAGLEMFAFHRNPGLAECDECGIRVQFGRSRAYHEIPALESKGWEFSSHCIGASAICPNCRSDENRKS